MSRKDRNKDRGGHHEPAPAAEPEKVDVTQRIGGASATDELGTTFINELISKGLYWCLSYKPIEAALAHLSPFMRGAITALPYVANFTVAKMPLAWFPSPVAAHAFKNIVEQTAHTLKHIVEEKHGKPITSDDVRHAVNEAASTALGTMYVVDPVFGFFHVKGAIHLMNLPRQHQHQQQHQNQRHGQQPAPQSVMPEFTLQHLIDQKVPACPQCVEQVQRDLSAKPAVEKKPEKKLLRQPLEIIGGCPDEDLRKEFSTWFIGLSQEQRQKVAKGFKHLDSYEEFVGFMAVEASGRLDMLDLLGDPTVRNVFDAVGQALGDGAIATKNALVGSLASIKRFDETVLADKVNQREQSRAAAPRKSIIGRLVRGSTF